MDGRLNQIVDAAARHACEGNTGRYAIIMLHAAIIDRARFEPRAAVLVKELGKPNALVEVDDYVGVIAYQLKGQPPGWLRPRRRHRDDAQRSESNSQREK